MSGVGDIRKRLLASRVALIDEVSGLTPDEIEEVANAHHHSLPTVYVEFLGAMGRSAGRLWRGSDALWPAPLELPSAADRLLAERGRPWALTDRDTVFLSTRVINCC
jgi:hypothetical protein